MLSELKGTFHIGIDHAEVEGGEEIQKILSATITIDNEEMDLLPSEYEIMMERFSEALERLLVKRVANLYEGILSDQAAEQYEYKKNPSKLFLKVAKIARDGIPK